MIIKRSEVIKINKIKIYTLTHIGEDYCKVESDNGNDVKEYELPLIVASLFLPENILEIDKGLEKHLDDYFGEID